jgi:hypothetical protein
VREFHAARGRRRGGRCPDTSSSSA